LGATAQDHNGIGFDGRIVDHPGIGQTSEERGTKNKAESSEKDCETT
jgi:hypothetical protein